MLSATVSDEVLIPQCLLAGTEPQEISEHRRRQEDTSNDTSLNQEGSCDVNLTPPPTKSVVAMMMGKRLKMGEDYKVY